MTRMTVSNRRDSWWLLPLVATIAASAVLLCHQWWCDFLSHRDVTVPEGSIVYSIRAVFHEHLVYRDFRSPPYATTPYTPLYYVVSALSASVMGEGVEAYYRGGRATSLAALITAMAIIFRHVDQTTGSRLAALVSVASLTTVEFLWRWGIACRPDILAATLSLAGVTAIARQTPGGRWVAFLCFTASILTKQSFIAAPVASCLWLCLRGQFGRAAWLTAMISIGLLTSVGGLEWYSGGRFWENVVGANVAPSDIQQPFRLLGYYLYASLLPLSLAVVGVACAGGKGSTDAGPDLIYNLCCLTIAVGTAAKAGADINYFLEPLLASTMFVGRGVEALRQWAGARVPRQVFLFAGLILVCEPTVFFMLPDKVYRLSAPKPSVEERALEALQDRPRPMLIGDAGLAVRLDQEPILLDKFNVSYLVDAGKVDVSELVDRLKTHNIRAVVSEVHLKQKISGQPWWPRPIQQAIQEHYQPMASIDGYWFFVPRSADDPSD